MGIEAFCALKVVANFKMLVIWPWSFNSNSFTLYSHLATTMQWRTLCFKDEIKCLIFTKFFLDFEKNLYKILEIFEDKVKKNHIKQKIIFEFLKSSLYVNINVRNILVWINFLSNSIYSN